MNEQWKPKYNEVYYGVESDLTIFEYVWYDHDSDMKLYKLGNCFRTKKQAKQAAERIKQVFNEMRGKG